MGAQVRAVWNGTVLAESDATIVVEGNHYFPPESLRGEYFEDAESTSFCSWKGEASYKTVVVDGRKNEEQRGTTHSRWTRPSRSPATWPSGAASRSKPDSGSGPARTPSARACAGGRAAARLW